MSIAYAIKVTANWMVFLTMIIIFVISNIFFYSKKFNFAASLEGGKIG